MEINTLLQRIRDAFPHLQWDSYDLNTQGWDHMVLILDKKYVFRFPMDDEYVQLLPIEIAVLNDLAPLVNITIPRYQFIAPDKSFAGYEIVRGTMLTKRFMDNLPAADQQEITKQLSKFLSTLHCIISIPGSSFARVPQTYMTQDQADNRVNVPKYLPKVLNEADMRIVMKIMEAVDLVIAQPRAETLIHGDIYNRHLLWDAPNRMLGLIDFSDMVKGDPAIDFSEIHEYGEAFVRQVYAHYKGPKDDTFLERAWIYQCWIAINMMTDHFITHHSSFAIARELFDRVKQSKRYPIN